MNNRGSDVDFLPYGTTAGICFLSPTFKRM
jgi:hypothetical protein